MMRRSSRQSLAPHSGPLLGRVDRRGHNKIATVVLVVTGAWLLIAWQLHARHAHVVAATTPAAPHAVHAPQFRAMHDAMRRAEAEVRRPEPRPPRAERPTRIRGYRSDPYGNDTLVLGAETCAAFRAANPLQSSRRFAPAGLFNSATNALWQTVLSNCRVSESGRNDLFHPPWGKHNPASWRGSHLAGMFQNTSALGWVPRLESVLPIVTVKDPLTWMASICRHPYAVRLSAKQRARCPVPLDSKVSVAFKKDRVKHYASLVDLWAEWHGEYLRAAWPRLLVRFEDLLFDPRSVVGAVCDCLGGALASEETFKIDGQKKGKGTAFGHGADTHSRAQALALYGSLAKRLGPYAASDVAFVRARLPEDKVWRGLGYDSLS